MNEKIYFCPKHSAIAHSSLERYTSQIGECFVCGEQASFYVIVETEIELPAERLAILGE
jgi:hypothetical protein